jgi:hypothetical protein
MCDVEVVTHNLLLPVRTVRPAPPAGRTCLNGQLVGTGVSRHLAPPPTRSDQPLATPRRDRDSRARARHLRVAKGSHQQAARLEGSHSAPRCLEEARTSFPPLHHWSTSRCEPMPQKPGFGRRGEYGAADEESMAAHPHRPPVRPLRNWPTLGGPGTIRVEYRGRSSGHLVAATIMARRNLEVRQETRRHRRNEVL